MRRASLERARAAPPDRTQGLRAQRDRQRPVGRGTADRGQHGYRCHRGWAHPHAAAQGFKDPYFLEFWGLRKGHDEADLEAAILRQLEAFILELGRSFAFVERQKRMVIDGDDFYLDLLFFHRRLRRLVAIELKLGRFKAAHKGQMELYLKWLDKHERQPGEEAPIGLILCAESSREQVELLQMHKDGITVAEYWTELPPKAELEQRLHQALLEARETMARRGVLLEGDGDE
ncbi:PDDEXK nuclease domain-containing protein [Ideonella sp. B508-1]|uniref:PDDEXK nuclease domain-containing protein n=1 Tax=Ideonella sp. B508-1 TaxID=137716 RepID=UPI001F371463|nr:PDDEXK nuclease domain-containing protein [Ideonella sp. B508-1]